MTIGKRSDRRPKYQLCKTILQQVDKQKDIGVAIEKNLQFDDTLATRSMFALLRRTFRHMVKKFFTPFYKTIV